MSNCSEYTVLHENQLGKVGYCFGCESYHLKMSGLLSVISDEQLSNIERNLSNMKSDLEMNHDVSDIEVGVQIKITNNTYLCLNYTEVLNGLELISMGQYMKTVNDLML